MMVMKRPARHLDLPPPLYQWVFLVYYWECGADVDEGLEGATGDEHNTEVGEGLEGAPEGDAADVGIVTDTNVEEINEQGDNVRLEDGVVREFTESGDNRDLDGYRDSDDKYLQKFKSDPKKNVKGFRVDIINELRVNVSRHQAYRAKKAALKQLEGSPEWQYSRLWDYLEEVRKTNPGSTVIVGTKQVDGEERFNRFYVCFGALKARFKAGCRPIIGVDGCHLKGPNGGILLTAIVVDPNNNLFPIAYAVVNKECRDLGMVPNCVEA
ncbi:UNVERIFIED_CONTAM: hypothetical protein Sangu_2243700 [Sesamum angustifolium]|uniref:Transposase n=1 Tax=Sesamum angustifolium TaxID=2727405 RepID=A0AAW2L5G4_9LAMI